MLPLYRRDNFIEEIKERITKDSLTELEGTCYISSCRHETMGNRCDEDIPNTFQWNDSLLIKG